MSKSLLGGLLSISLLVLAGCGSSVTHTADSQDDTTSNTSTIVSGSQDLLVEDDVEDMSEDSIFDDYASVGDLDLSYSGARNQGQGRFWTNDQDRGGTYYPSRDRKLIGYMGIHAADIAYGYGSGNIYIDLGDRVVKFPVDQSSFISYHPQLENPYYPNTGDMIVRDQQFAYPVCRDSELLADIEVVYDRERYEALRAKNPMRCVAEDKDYVYGWKEEREKEYQDIQRGYELIRIRK